MYKLTLLTIAAIDLGAAYAMFTNQITDYQFMGIVVLCCATAVITTLNDVKE